ncbi:MAG: hypothetical protein UY39_C0039G0007 [Candidatus Kaiserbacteria bacterium GW2011_GWC2_49_12]|uniref:Uncharacterized protein n=1 Tax=Candidatus Kaiserbacteria bacterium GW2011_GWC2_49_12 TaxID=1618675 RepID=A0A0G1VJD3_9BACT|nr:MAG: hypothetical protein UY39_C0039G0007 [Candidatus Kaiserbacteria bacterium GW2011_GWC2_49_12]
MLFSNCMERGPNERKIGEILKPLSAAALASFLAHAEPSYSAEIPPEASWRDGIEALHRGVVTDTAEHVGWYVMGEREQWLAPPTRGDPDERFYEGNPAELLPSDEEVGVMCEMHNHVLESFLRAQEQGHAPSEPSADTIRSFREQFERDPLVIPPPIDAPPSYGDVSIERHEILRSQIQERLGHEIEMRHGVKTVQGIWYWDFLPSAKDLQAYPALPRLDESVAPQEPRASISEITLQYVRTLQAGEDAFEARATLSNAYEQTLGVRIRFVQNEEIATEPVCAGAHYQEDGN